MNEWTNEWMNEPRKAGMSVIVCMNAWMHESSKAWRIEMKWNENAHEHEIENEINEWVNDWLHECMNAWMHELIHEWRQEWMKKWIEESMKFANVIFQSAPEPSVVFRFLCEQLLDDNVVDI